MRNKLVVSFILIGLILNFWMLCAESYYERYCIIDPDKPEAEEFLKKLTPEQKLDLAEEICEKGTPDMDPGLPIMSIRMHIGFLLLDLWDRDSESISDENLKVIIKRLSDKNANVILKDELSGIVQIILEKLSRTGTFNSQYKEIKSLLNELISRDSTPLRIRLSVCRELVSALNVKYVHIVQKDAQFLKSWDKNKLIENLYPDIKSGKIKLEDATWKQLDLIYNEANKLKTVLFEMYEDAKKTPDTIDEETKLNILKLYDKKMPDLLDEIENLPKPPSK